MKHTVFFSLCALALITTFGCNENASDRPASQVLDDTMRGTEPNNTGVNVRDRNESAKTPLDQNENQKDIDITANIRRRIVDSQKSIDARNIKIITQDGRVTLRGPVKSTEEKQALEAIAKEVAGATNVDSQLEVGPSNP